MKKIILLSVLTILAFTACEKDLYDAELAKQRQTVKDLVVPENFDWEMTQTVTINLTAAIETPVCVYVNEKCTDEYKILDYTIIPGLEMPVSVSVPTAINKLYVKYGDVIEFVGINNQKAELALATTKATTRGWANGKDEVLMSVGKNWSTLMFEDLFPKLGDYDFNDFVANYRYNIVYVVSSKDQNNLSSSHILGYEFEFRVNAIGANLPITPYLRVSTKAPALMDAFDTNDLTIIASKPNIKVELVSKASGYQVYKIIGMTDKPINEFLNTEKGKALEAPLTLKIEVPARNQGYKWDAAYTANLLEFDFFITNGTDEIHKRGFGPVLNLRPYPTNEVEGGAGDQYYSNSKNLIWAIDIPAVLNHATEKTNFLSVYPQFRDWATSGGMQATNWYDNPVGDKLIDYMGAFPIQ